MTERRGNKKASFDPEMSVLQARTSRLTTATSDNDEEEEDDDEDDEYAESELPPRILRRVAALKALQEQSDEIDSKYKEERIALESKYRVLKLPLLSSRDKIVSGEVDVPKSADDAFPEDAEELEEDVPKGIPGYWAQCLVNHPAVEDICTTEDIPAMEAISNITCEYNPDYSSFTLSFFFDENVYFTNTVLKKTYTVSPDLLDEKSPTLTGHATSEIEWKPSMNLCMLETKKKQKSKSGKNKGQVRTVTQQEPKQSFFQYFSEPVDDEEDEEDEDDEDKQIRIKLTVDEDYEIGHCIRTAVIPESVLWFTGEANEEDDMDEHDEDDLEDADEDDDEEGGPGVTKTIGGGFASTLGAPSAKTEEPECKQN